jgi:hypothetical protein
MLMQLLHNRYWKCGWYLGCPVYASEAGKLMGISGTLLWFDPDGWWNCCSITARAGENTPGLPKFIAKGLVAPGAENCDMSAVQWMLPWDSQNRLCSLRLESGANWLDTQVTKRNDQLVLLQAELDAGKKEQELARVVSKKKFDDFASFYCHTVVNDTGDKRLQDHEWLVDAKGWCKGKGKVSFEAATAKGHSKGYSKGQADAARATEAARAKGYSKGQAEGYAQGLTAGAAQAAKGKGKKGKDDNGPPSKSGWCNKMVCLLGAIKQDNWGKVNRLVEVFLDCKFGVLILFVHVLCFVGFDVGCVFLFVFITYAVIRFQQDEKVEPLLRRHLQQIRATGWDQAYQYEV